MVDASHHLRPIYTSDFWMQLWYAFFVHSEIAAGPENATVRCISEFQSRQKRNEKRNGKMQFKNAM